MSSVKNAVNFLLFSVALGGGLVHSYVVSPIAFKHLPIEHFSNLQNKVFPNYFLGQALIPVVLSLTTPLPLKVAGPVLAASGVAGALNLLWVLPVCKDAKEQKKKLESERAHEQIVDGQIVPTEQYKAWSKKFGMYHGISSLLNLVSLLSLVVYGVYLGRLMPLVK